MTDHVFTNAMTVDVEDYFHVSGFSGHVSTRDWDSYPSRVVANTERILDLLNRHQTRGTFFVLGWVAERFPALVRSIQKAGHEIGCHSHWHRLVYSLTPDEFRSDLIQSRNVLEDITGDAVQLYRAPSFSITRQSLWALEILADEGFTCDSSIYPVYHDRYGIPDADIAPHRVVTGDLSIDEFPGSVFQLGRMRLAISGGGYFRLYPRRFTDFCFSRVNRQSRLPFMFYIHPWEVDPDQPRLPGPLMSRFRHYQNLATTERKLDWLLPRFRFGSMSESLESMTGDIHEYRLSDGLYGNREYSLNERSPELQVQSG